MDVSPPPLKSLLHQAISLVEEFYNRNGGSHPASSSRWLPLDSENGEKLDWLKPNPNCDLAARVALSLARNNRSHVGYLAVGECAVHAVARLWFMSANVDASKVLSDELEEDDFPRMTRAAGYIAASSITICDRNVPAHRIQQTTRRFVEECELDFIVVDDPDAATLREPNSLPEQERFRIRMAFREAVRGTSVCMILPGWAPGFRDRASFG